ncbi:MAG: alpha/beta hydrolase [Brevibacterium sp.]|nr:alpha/beta hydrolase [Brevibacterium sandarakinum]MDN5586650.1 alpha/beta hydrolase [Brevibacterium sp.]
MRTSSDGRRLVSPSDGSAPGHFCNAQELQIHVCRHDAGNGRGPWAVLESALGCPATAWVLVQRALAERGISSLAYDRPGIGFSGGRRPDKAVKHASRLASVLAAENIGEAVFVGHSVGGLLVRSHAAQHPELVSGLVLIDSSHPNQQMRSVRQREVMYRLEARMLRMLRNPPPLNETPAEYAPLTEPYASLTHHRGNSPAGIRGSKAELRMWRGSWAKEAGKSTDFGDLPLAVVTAGLTAENDPAHMVLQTELSQLSDKGHHLVVEGASHQGLIMEPEYAELASSAIAGVVAEATFTTRKVGQQS